jgi:hypothetical protein
MMVKEFEELDEQKLEHSTKIVREHYDQRVIKDGIFFRETDESPEMLHQNIANMTSPLPFELRYMMFLRETKYASPKRECHCESCEGECAHSAEEVDAELDKIRKARMAKLMSQKKDGGDQ